MIQLPLTVIGGYLGAGKTTLINHVLAADHGLRILVLVNDFGAINIDASLLISSDEDTIELANGCVCCTMGADLFLAVGDVLDRTPRPDHLIIEASGIADPARIANVARAEPDLRYAGIVTVVDETQFERLNADPMIAPQIHGQITCADILALSKTDGADGIGEILSAINPNALQIRAEAFDITSVLLTEMEPGEMGEELHPAYTKWSFTGRQSFDRGQLAAALAERPEHLYRIKGQIRGPSGKGYLVQVAGNSVGIEEIPQPEQGQLVGIGLASRLSATDCEAWWSECCATCGL